MFPHVDLTVPRDEVRALQLPLPPHRGAGWKGNGAWVLGLREVLGPPCQTPRGPGGTGLAG